MSEQKRGFVYIPKWFIAVIVSVVVYLFGGVTGAVVAAFFAITSEFPDPSSIPSTAGPENIIAPAISWLTPGFVVGVAVVGIVHLIVFALWRYRPGGSG